MLDINVVSSYDGHVIERWLQYGGRLQCVNALCYIELFGPRDMAALELERWLSYTATNLGFTAQSITKRDLMCDVTTPSSAIA